MTEYKPITIPEAKEIIEKENSKRELGFEQKAALQHSIAFSKLAPEDSKKLVLELMKIENITITLAVKMADILPNHPDDVRVIFAKERFVLEQKTIDNILKSVEKYL